MISFSNKAMLLACLIVGSAISKVSSFTTNKAPFFVPRQATKITSPNTGGQHVVRKSSSSSLSVLIYGWDEDDDECTVTDSTNEYGFPVCSAVGVALAESISQNPDKVATLARLAAAFSPPERAVDLKDIEHVQLTCVSEKHVEIEATLCEDHNCVSLMVPIEFPRDCGGDVPNSYLERCVLDNLQYLDVEAESLVVSKSGQGEAQNNDMSLDQLSQDFSYPSWWVPPNSSPDLVTECDTIIGLLSDPEFQGSVDGLARKGLEALGIKDKYEITRAVLVAVGPAGVCLKAQGYSRIEGQAGSGVVLDVPLPFGGEPRLEPNLLRAAVLGEVAACEVL